MSRPRVIIVIVIALATLTFVVLWAFQGNAPRVAGPELLSVGDVAKVESLARLPADYANPPRPVAPPPSPPPPEPPPPERTEREYQREEQQAVDEAAERRRREAEAAARAPVLFQVQRRDIGEKSDQGEPEQPNSRDLVSLAATPSWRENDAFADQNGQEAKEAFLNRPSDPNIYGSGRLETPRSPFQISAGTIIAGALLTGLNSDLPGQVIAQVTENVYDTASGKHLLIPQGSRLLGQYDSKVMYGQDRVLLAWTRLIMPDDSSIVLDRLPATDPAGYSGLGDEVDNHWGQLIGGAVLSTLLGIGSELDSDGDDKIANAIRQSAQGNVDQVGQQFTRRNLNRQPTLTVRPGFPVRVIVNKDLVLRPYRATRLHAVLE